MESSDQTTWPIAVLCVAVVLALTALTTHLPAESNNDSGHQSLSRVDDPNVYRPDLAEKLRMTLDSVELSAKISPPFGHDSSLAQRTLIVSMSFPFRRANGMVGVDLANPIILGAIDGKGNEFAFVPARSPWHRYEALRYTANRLSTSSRASIPPGGLVSLRLDSHQSVPSTLSKLKWYVYALHAEDVIVADVPSRVSSEWTPVEAAPDLQIRVAEVGLHRYRTAVRSLSGSVVRGLNEELRCGDAVPDYVVLETRFIDSENVFLLQPVQFVHGSPIGGETYCYAEAALPSGSEHRIRHIIAVHPVEVKLPFELTDIPVPSLQAAK